MKPIKVGYIDISHIFSGAERSLSDMIVHIDRKVVEPVLFLKYPMTHHERFSGLECQIRYVSKQARWWMGGDYWAKPLRGTDFIARILYGYRIATMAKADKIDVIHINLLKPSSFWYMFWARLVGMKVVSHARSDHWAWIPPSWIQGWSHIIISVSDFVRNRLKSKSSSSHVVTVYDPVVAFDSYPVSRKTALQKLDYPKDQMLFSSVGLLSPQKGHDMAIRVFKHLSNSYPRSNLLIAGGGSADELGRLKRLAEDEGVSTRVRFTGSQIQDISLVYRASTLVFSLTSTGEAFGRVPFEAMFCGTPVLAPNKGAAVELITHHVNGFLVDPLDIQQIKNLSLWILDHPGDADRVVHQAQKTFAEIFSPYRIAKKYENIYRDLLAR